MRICVEFNNRAEYNFGMVDELNIDRLSVTSFESQFRDKKIVEGLFGRIEITHVIPEIVKADTLPLVVASGLGSPPEVNKKIIQGFYDQGREVVYPNYDEKNGSAVPVEESGINYPEDTLRKAQALIASLDENNTKRVDIMGHSQGALVAVTAATLRPDLFNTITLVEPPGMTDNDNVWALMARQLFKENPVVAKRKSGEQTVKDVSDQADKAFVSHIAKSPRRMWNELQAASSTDMPQLIQALQDTGIKMAIVNAGHDFIFGTKEASNTISSKLSRKVNIDGKSYSEYDISFISVAGSHNEIHYQPEKWTKALDAIVTALDNKKDNKTRVGYPEAKSVK